MIQDIKFQGLSNSPSDNSVQDGELGSCLNLIPEDGELKPIQQPVMVDGGDFLSEGMTIEYIHKVSYDSEIKSHYICYDDLNDGWYWHLLSEPNNVFHEIPLPAADDFHVNSVTSIGNILCFVGSGSGEWEKEFVRRCGGAGWGHAWHPGVRRNCAKICFS